tara:strand:- start:3111 stop:3527 length:417 start_codon:yes stop_codon:yes gene_type:complete
VGQVSAPVTGTVPQMPRFTTALASTFPSECHRTSPVHRIAKFVNLIGDRTWTFGKGLVHFIAILLQLLKINYHRIVTLAIQYAMSVSFVLGVLPIALRYQDNQNVVAKAIIRVSIARMLAVRVIMGFAKRINFTIFSF